jgi:hypothetical protein
VKVGHKQRPPSPVLHAQNRTRFRPVPGSGHAFMGHPSSEALTRLHGRRTDAEDVLCSCRDSPKGICVADW